MNEAKSTGSSLKTFQFVFLLARLQNEIPTKVCYPVKWNGMQADSPAASLRKALPEGPSIPLLESNMSKIRRVLVFFLPAAAFSLGGTR